MLTRIVIEWKCQKLLYVVIWQVTWQPCKRGKSNRDKGAQEASAPTVTSRIRGISTRLPHSRHLHRAALLTLVSAFITIHTSCFNSRTLDGLSFDQPLSLRGHYRLKCLLAMRQAQAP